MNYLYMPPYQILFCDVCKNKEKNYYETKCKEALTGNVYCYHYWIKLKKYMTNKYNDNNVPDFEENKSE